MVNVVSTLAPLRSQSDFPLRTSHAGGRVRPPCSQPPSTAAPTVPHQSLRQTCFLHRTGMIRLSRRRNLTLQVGVVRDRALAVPRDLSGDWDNGQRHNSGRFPRSPRDNSQLPRDRALATSLCLPRPTHGTVHPRFSRNEPAWGSPGDLATPTAATNRHGPPIAASATRRPFRPGSRRSSLPRPGAA